MTYEIQNIALPIITGGLFLMALNNQDTNDKKNVQKIKKNVQKIKKIVQKIL